MLLYSCNHIFSSLMLRFLFLIDKRYRSSHVYITNSVSTDLQHQSCFYVKVFSRILILTIFFSLFLFFLVEQQQKSEGGQETLSLSPHHGFDKSQLNDCPRDSGCYISSENSDNGKEEVDPETLSDMVQSVTITEANWFSPAAFLQIFRKDDQICGCDAQKQKKKNLLNTEKLLLSDVWCSRLFNNISCFSFQWIHRHFTEEVYTYVFINICTAKAFSIIIKNWV